MFIRKNYGDIFYWEIIGEIRNDSINNIEKNSFFCITERIDMKKALNEISTKKLTYNVIGIKYIFKILSQL